MPSQLIYSSTAVRPMSARDLRALLRHARRKNERLGITGLLLYRGESFLQVLEGEHNAVEGLYDTIAQDDRHHSVTRVSGQSVSDYTFPDWSMGFRNLDDADAADLPDGFVPFMEDGFRPDYFAEQPTHAQNILLKFRDAAE